MKKISISIRLKITRITILLTVAAAAQGGWIKVPLLKDSEAPIKKYGTVPNHGLRGPEKP